MNMALYVLVCFQLTRSDGVLSDFGVPAKSDLVDTLLFVHFVKIYLESSQIYIYHKSSTFVHLLLLLSNMCILLFYQYIQEIGTFMYKTFYFYTGLSLKSHTTPKHFFNSFIPEEDDEMIHYSCLS